MIGTLSAMAFITEDLIQNILNATDAFHVAERFQVQAEMPVLAKKSDRKTACCLSF
jgi:hypothetical protein